MSDGSRDFGDDQRNRLHCWTLSKFPKKPKRLTAKKLSSISDNNLVSSENKCNSFSYSNLNINLKSLPTLLSSYLLILIVLINLWGNVSQVEAVCVWQGGGSFRLACGFRQSGLFRIRSLGGLKGYVGAGFTIGDEDGFKDSMTNTDPRPVPGPVQIPQQGYGYQNQRTGLNLQQQEMLAAYSQLNEQKVPPNGASALQRQQEQLRYIQQIQAEQLLEHQMLQQKVAMQRQQKTMEMAEQLPSPLPQHMQFSRRQMEAPIPTPPQAGRGGLTKRASLWGWPFSGKNNKQGNSNNNNGPQRVRGPGGQGQSLRFRGPPGPPQNFQHQQRPLGPIGMGAGGFDPRFQSQNQDVGRQGDINIQYDPDEFEVDTEFEDLGPPPPQGRQNDLSSFPSQMMLPPPSPSRGGPPPPRFRQVSDRPHLREDTSHLQLGPTPTGPGVGPVPNGVSDYLPHGLKMLSNTQNFGSIFRLVDRSNANANGNNMPPRKMHRGQSSELPRHRKGPQSSELPKNKRLRGQSLELPKPDFSSIMEEEIPSDQLQPQHRQLQEEEEEDQVYLSGVGNLDKNAMATAVYDPNVFPDIYFTTTERGGHKKPNVNRMMSHEQQQNPEETPEEINHISDPENPENEQQLDTAALHTNEDTFVESPAVRRKKLRRRKKKFRLLKRKGKLSIDTINPEEEEEHLEGQVQEKNQQEQQQNQEQEQITQPEEQEKIQERQGESAPPFLRRRKKGKRKKFMLNPNNNNAEGDGENNGENTPEVPPETEPKKQKKHRRPNPTVRTFTSGEKKRISGEVQEDEELGGSSGKSSRKKVPSSGESRFSSSSVEKSQRKFPGSSESKSDNISPPFSSSIEKSKRKFPTTGSSEIQKSSGSFEKSKKKFPISSLEIKTGSSEKSARKKFSSNSFEAQRDELQGSFDKSKKKFASSGELQFTDPSPTLMAKFREKFPGTGSGESPPRDQLSSSSAEHIFYPHHQQTTTTTISTTTTPTPFEMSTFGYHEALDKKPQALNNPPSQKYNEENHEDDYDAHYDPRYPPNHEVNKGRIPNKFIRQRGPTPLPSSTTPTPYRNSQSLKYNQSGYAPSANSFFGSLPKAETTKFSPAQDYGSTFVHFDSRESLRSIEKTKNYNDQFYSSHFNKTSANQPENSFNSNFGPTAFSNPGFYDISPGLSREMQPPSPYQQSGDYPPRPPSGEDLLPWEKQSMTSERPQPIFPKYNNKNNFGNNNNNGYNNGPTMETFGLPRVTTPMPFNSIDDNENDEMKRNLFGGNSGGDEHGDNNGNWEAPNFWGSIQQADRYGPAADFVTNDNFKRVLDLERANFHPHEIPPPPPLPPGDEEQYSTFFSSTPGTTRWSKPRRKQKFQSSSTPSPIMQSTTVIPLSEEGFNSQPGWDATGSTESSSFGLKVLKEIPSDNVNDNLNDNENVNEMEGNFISSTTEMPEQIKRIRNKHGKRRRPKRPEVSIKIKGESQPGTQPNAEPVTPAPEVEIQNQNQPEVVQVEEEQVILPNTQEVTDILQNEDINIKGLIRGSSGENIPLIKVNLGPPVKNIFPSVVPSAGQSGELRMSDFNSGGDKSVFSSAASIPSANNMFPPSNFQHVNNVMNSHNEVNPFANFESGFNSVNDHGFVSSNAEFSDLAKQINEMTFGGLNSQNNAHRPPLHQMPTLIQHRDNSEEHLDQHLNFVQDPPRPLNNNKNTYGSGGGSLSMSLQPPLPLPSQLPNIVPSPPDPLLHPDELNFKNFFGNNNNNKNKQNRLSEFPTSIPVLQPPPMPLSPEEEQQQRQHQAIPNNNNNDNEHHSDLQWESNKYPKIKEEEKKPEKFKIIPHPIQILNIQNNIPIPPEPIGNSLGFNDPMSPAFNLNFQNIPDTFESQPPTFEPNQQIQNQQQIQQHKNFENQKQNNFGNVPQQNLRNQNPPQNNGNQQQNFRNQNQQPQFRNPAPPPHDFAKMPKFALPPPNFVNKVHNFEPQQQQSAEIPKPFGKELFSNNQIQGFTDFIKNQMDHQKNNFKDMKNPFEGITNLELPPIKNTNVAPSIKIVRPTNIPKVPNLSAQQQQQKIKFMKQQQQREQAPQKQQNYFPEPPRIQKPPPPRPLPPKQPPNDFYPPLRDDSIKFDENRNNFHPYPHTPKPYFKQQQQRPQQQNNNFNDNFKQQSPPQPPNFQKNPSPNPKKYKDQMPKIKPISSYEPPSPKNNFNSPTLPLPHNPFIINSNPNKVLGPTKIPAQKFQPPPPPPTKQGFLSPITNMFSNPFNRGNNNNNNNNGQQNSNQNPNQQNPNQQQTQYQQIPQNQNQYHQQKPFPAPMNNNNNFQNQQQFNNKPPSTSQMTIPSQQNVNNHMNPFNTRFKPPPPVSHSQNTLNLNLRKKRPQNEQRPQFQNEQRPQHDPRTQTQNDPRPQNGVEVTYVDLDSAQQTPMIPFSHIQQQAQRNQQQQQQRNPPQQYQQRDPPQARPMHPPPSHSPPQQQHPLSDKQKVLQAIATLNNVKYDVIQSVAEEQFGSEILEKLKAKKVPSTLPPPPTRPTTRYTTTTTPTTTPRPSLFPFLSSFSTTLAPYTNTGLNSIFKLMSKPTQQSNDMQMSPSGMSNLLGSFGGYGDSALPPPTQGKGPSMVSMSTDAITNLFHSLTSGETKSKAQQRPIQTTTTTSRPQLTGMNFDPSEPEVQDIKSLQAQLAKAIIAKANRKKFVAQTPTAKPKPSGGNPMGLLNQLANTKNYTQSQIATLKKLIALNNIEQKLNNQMGQEQTTKGSMLKIGGPTMKSPSTSLFSGLLGPSGMSSLFSSKMLMDSSSDLNSINQVQNNLMGSNDPTLLALKALALKKAQNINPNNQKPNVNQNPVQDSPVTMKPKKESSHSNSDFKPIPVDLSAILSPSPPLEEPKRRLTDVRNAPRSFYPANATMGFDSLPSLSLSTSFQCESQTFFPGLYADTELGCKVFHLCAKTDAGYLMKSFRCPKETVFDQEVLKCNWNLYVDCPASQNKYHFNKYLSQSFQFLKVLGEFSAGMQKNATVSG